MGKWKAISTESGKGVFHLFPGLCKGCGLCLEKCPTNTITWSKNLGVYGTPAVEPQQDPACIACGICQNVCPDTAIVIEKKPDARKEAQAEKAAKPDGK